VDVIADSARLGRLDLAVLNIGVSRVRKTVLDRMDESAPQKSVKNIRGLPGLTEEGRARADPEFREEFEIFPVNAGDHVFLSARDSKRVFSCRNRPDFFHKRSVHEHRSVDTDESVGFEPFGHPEIDSRNK
jgi:hypothetical protein